VKLDAVATPPSSAGFGGRFYLVGYLPTYAATLFVLVLIWAGAPGWSRSKDHRIRFTAAWATASHLSLGEVVMVALAVALLAVILQPLQLAMVSLAEGSWPTWLGAEWARRRQRSRRNRLEKAQELPVGPALTDEAVQRAGAAGYQLRRRFPIPDHLLRPTALGNVLAAMTNRAGRAYGLDAVIAWPRLYPVLGDQVKSLVDDRRDALDAAVRLAATMAVTAVASFVLLLRSSWWILLVLIPLSMAVLAYNAAVQAALAYSETVHVALTCIGLTCSPHCEWNCHSSKTASGLSTDNGAIFGARESRCPPHCCTRQREMRLPDIVQGGSLPARRAFGPGPGSSSSTIVACSIRRPGCPHVRMAARTAAKTRATWLYQPDP
jgi:hypothetical protein